MTAACERAALVEAMFDGRLGPSERASTERHVKSCSSCTELLGELTSVAELLRSSATRVSPLEHQRARLSLLRQTAEPPAKKRRTAALLVAALTTLPIAVWATTGSRTGSQVHELSSVFSPRNLPRTSVGARKHAHATPLAATSEAAAPLASAAATGDAVAPTRAPPTRPRATPAKATTAAENSRTSQDFAAAMDSLARGDFGASAGKLAGFASTHSGDPRAEDATYLEAIALERAGRLGEAQAAARRYLAAYPHGAHLVQARRIAHE